MKEKRKKELTIGEEFGILTERQTPGRKTVAKSGRKIRERLKKCLTRAWPSAKITKFASAERRH